MNNNLLLLDHFVMRKINLVLLNKNVSQITISNILNTFHYFENIHKSIVFIDLELMLHYLKNRGLH